jgi:hypothetical protein
MPLIQLNDGILVEIRESGSGRQETAGRDFVDTTIENAVERVLPKLVGSIGKALKGLRETLDVPIKVSEAEVEFGLSFSMEGNLYVAKAKTEGTLAVRIKFDPIGLPPARQPNQ